MDDSGRLLEFLASRRSTRRFRAGDVSRATLERLLSVACAAPSAHNGQPWRFVVIPRGERRRPLIDAMAARFRVDLERDGRPSLDIDHLLRRSHGQLLDAPVLIVVCLDPGTMTPYPDERRRQLERAMAIQSVAMAGMNLLLAAHAEGLGGCWMCAPLFAADAARAVLCLEEWEPQGLVLIGRAAETPPPRTTLPLDEVVRWT